ncbi:hypothetical protein B0H11DRAFT_2231727 [Mycena galericulata]|nr:hypothetical protein B0H11DRAFT_2231727 [Mycena galericulata]
MYELMPPRIAYKALDGGRALTTSNTEPAAARRAAGSRTVWCVGGFLEMSSAERRGAVRAESGAEVKPAKCTAAAWWLASLFGWVFAFFASNPRHCLPSPAKRSGRRLRFADDIKRSTVARYYLTCKEGVGTHYCDLSARPQLILGGAVRSRVHIIHDASDWRALGVRASSRRLAFDRGWRERDEPIVSRTVRRRSPSRMHFEARDVGRIKKADGRRMPVHTFLLVHDDHPGWRPRADAQIHCTIPPPPLPESRKLHRNLAATSHSSGRCIDEGVSFSGYPVTIFPKTSHIPPRRVPLLSTLAHCCFRETPKPAAVWAAS